MKCSLCKKDTHNIRSCPLKNDKSAPTGGLPIPPSNEDSSVVKRNKRKKTVERESGSEVPAATEEINVVKGKKSKASGRECEVSAPVEDITVGKKGKRKEIVSASDVLQTQESVATTHTRVTRRQVLPQHHSHEKSNPTKVTTSAATPTRRKESQTTKERHISAATSPTKVTRSQIQSAVISPTKVTRTQTQSTPTRRKGSQSTGHTSVATSPTTRSQSVAATTPTRLTRSQSKGLTPTKELVPKRTQKIQTKSKTLGLKKKLEVSRKKNPLTQGASFSTAKGPVVNKQMVQSQPEAEILGSCWITSCGSIVDN